MILQNKFVWILQSKPKKKPNINPKQIPKGPTQTYSKKKKKKKPTKTQYEYVSPQSSNGKAKT